jgi:N6-adenosine-specific RNA methylase IME4
MWPTVCDLSTFAAARQFSTILADPPWQFMNKTGKIAPEHRRLSRYGTMSLEEIMALPVAKIAANRAHLYLWCPNALLPDGLSVMKAWGFSYKSNIVWHKVRMEIASATISSGVAFAASKFLRTTSACLIRLLKSRRIARTPTLTQKPPVRPESQRFGLAARRWSRYRFIACAARRTVRSSLSAERGPLTSNFRFCAKEPTRCDRTIPPLISGIVRHVRSSPDMPCATTRRNRGPPTISASTWTTRAEMEANRSDGIEEPHFRSASSSSSNVRGTVFCS